MLWCLLNINTESCALMITELERNTGCNNQQNCAHRTVLAHDLSRIDMEWPLCLAMYFYTVRLNDTG